MPAEATIRIAILADFPWSALDGSATGRGGGQGCTWLPQLAESFARFPEFDIHWIRLDRKNGKRETVRKFGQTFHRLPAVSMSADLAAGNWPTRFILRRQMRQLKPDIVHAWGTELIYPAALRDFRGPTILSMQGVLTEYQRIGGLPNDWRWRKMVAREPEMIRSATVVTSESEWGISKVQEIDPNANCHLVEYGVHPRFYEIPWKPDPKNPYALYVGGCGTRKGFDVLLDALARVQDRNWELRLAGDDSMNEEIITRGLPGVRCLGLLSWEAMQTELQGAWVSILPTRGDTSPNSVKEARVIGLPVITTKHGGQAGYIHDGVNGRIVDPLDTVNLAVAMEDVMSSIQRVRELGAGRHREDREYLRPERTADGFAAIYRHLSNLPSQTPR
ncbi:glycosyltransferase family 4 protein [Luteolibacter soli]|uniref:Glycosyltransferase family 4 protein n=1 Tax=Luteolibacter soli TaxID=3135280 RepID=A0ABU9AT73_9BACT